MKTSAKLVCILLANALLLSTLRARADDSATLTEYISKLQHNPSDQGLRKKIIQLVAGMNPKPEVPLEASEHEGSAAHIFKNAKTNADYARVAAEYEKASLIAPWIAADYYNASLAWEKAGQVERAIAAYQLYLMAAPQAEDRNFVAQKIGELKVQLEDENNKASRGSKNAPGDSDAEFIRRLDGTAYEKHFRDGPVESWEIEGNDIVRRWYDAQAPGPNGPHPPAQRYRIEGRKIVVAMDPGMCQRMFGTRDCATEGIITEKNLSFQSVVNGREIGRHTLSDVSFPRVRKSRGH